MNRTPGRDRNDAGGAGSLGGDRSFGGYAGVGGTGGGEWAEQAAGYGTGSSGGAAYAGIAAEASSAGRLPSGYQVLRRTGTGRNSTVLLCHEEATGQEVAVKLMNLTVDDEATRLAAHSELLSAGAAAKHPCSVAVEDAGFSPDNRPYLVEQFCRGGNAQAKLANSGPFPVDEVIVIGIRLSLALASSHRRGVLHLDVRPANILYDDAGDALLADHGVTRIVQRSAPQLGAIFDPMFSSRELFGWEKPGPAADVYSLGATLYALLNGLPAYAEAGSTSWAALYQEVLKGDLPRPNRPDVPEPLFDLISRMMAANPEGRPPLNEVHRALRMMLRPAYAARVPALDPEPEPEPMLPGWDPADDVTPEEQAEAERHGAQVQAEMKRRQRRRVISTVAALVVFAAGATAITLLVEKDKAARKAAASASASASAPAELQAQQVPQSELAALMPRGVTVTEANGSVRVDWKPPEDASKVSSYAVQAMANGTRVGLEQVGKAQSQVVFSASAQVAAGTCYTVASVMQPNGQMEYAPAQEVCLAAK